MNKEISEVLNILEEVLYEFPVQEVNIKLPLWVEELDSDFWLRADLEGAIREVLRDIKKVRDIDKAIEKLSDIKNISFVYAAHEKCLVNPYVPSI
jgi:stage IV sporulation protein A